MCFIWVLAGKTMTVSKKALSKFVNARALNTSGPSMLNEINRCLMAIKDEGQAQYMNSSYKELIIAKNIHLQPAVRQC